MRTSTITALAALVVTALWLAPLTHAAAPEVPLAAAGDAKLPVIVAKDASPAVRQSAKDLAQYLGKISGATFKVEEGDGTHGIAVGKASDFPAASLPDDMFEPSDALRREDYLLRSRAAGIYVIGATDLGTQHAVWDLLRRLGYRQFFPSARWEVIPNTPDLRIAVDATERPDYCFRRIWYGYGNWPDTTAAKVAWDARNRMAGGLEVSSGHAYDAIYHAKKAEFDKHPEYLCSTQPAANGKQPPIKFAISNPDLRKLVIDYALDHFAKNPKADSISMEPSDGGGWENADEEKAFKSVSDRVVTLANEVAEAVNQKYKNKYVGIYAYYQHSPPPTIRVNPHVIVSVATSFIQGGYTVDQLMSGWQRQGATLGVREYYSVVIWHKDRPGGPGAGNLRHLAETTRHFHDLGARLMNAESSDSWGPAGLGYYLASRMLWNTKEDPDAIVNDFLDKAFGPAKEPMRQFYQLIDGGNKPLFSRHLIGSMYRQLDAARKLTDDPGIRARIDELALYTRYAELLWDLEESADKTAGTQAILSFAYRIRHTGMVNSLALWRDTRGGFAKPEGDTVWNVPEGKNPWKNSAPFTAQDIQTFIRDGIEKNPIASFAPVHFSDNLVPAAPLKLKSDQPGHYGHTRSRQAFDVWLEAPGTLKLEVTAGQVSAREGQATVNLYAVEDPTGAVTATAQAPIDVKPHTVELTSAFKGRHRLEVLDSGRGASVVWPAGTPVSLASSGESQTLLRGTWEMYFYVPLGTKVVGGFADGSGAVFDADGKIIHQFTSKQPPGYFAIPVAPGQDGKLWKFSKSTGRRLLMTVPPYLARSADELLLPKEVVESDAGRQSR